MAKRIFIGAETVQADEFFEVTSAGSAPSGEDGTGPYDSLVVYFTVGHNSTYPLDTLSFLDSAHPAVATVGMYTTIDFIGQTYRVKVERMQGDDSVPYVIAYLKLDSGEFPDASATEADLARYKGMYNGRLVGGARRVKKLYLGIDGKARKIRKAYIGVGGLARPCFSTELEYYGTISPLSVARSKLAATAIGDYALFGGGSARGEYTDATGLDTVDAYNSSLTRSIPSPLDSRRFALAATTLGDHALFIGGYTDYYGNALNKVDAYDSSLTLSKSYYGYAGRGYGAATTVGNYALFGGGSRGDTLFEDVVVY